MIKCVNPAAGGRNCQQPGRPNPGYNYGAFLLSLSVSVFYSNREVDTGTRQGLDGAAEWLVSYILCFFKVLPTTEPTTER